MKIAGIAGAVLGVLGGLGWFVSWACWHFLGNHELCRTLAKLAGAGGSLAIVLAVVAASVGVFLGARENDA